MKAPKVSLDKIEQEIDLSEFIDFDFTDERSLKEAIGQAIIDKIVERTGDGIGVNGKRLKSPYSKEYSHSLEFKAAGKKPNKVNMELTGDMLASLDVLALDGSKIIVEVGDPDQIPKAYNHIVGDTVPKRNWFGITKAEISAIIEDFRPDIEMAAKAPGEVDKSGDNPARINLLDLFSNDGEGD